jgi:hypothetical protein
MLSDYSYSEYGIDNDAIIATYFKLKNKINDLDKIQYIESKMKDIKIYKVIFFNNLFRINE